MTDFVAPAYGARSLCDVVPAAARALGHALGPEPEIALRWPEAPAYVIFLVDGLGATLLQRNAQMAPFLAELLAGQEAGTATVPSTTATSLASLGTALPPGSHGLVGYTSRVPGTEKLLNALSWDKHVDPLEWQPNQTAFGRLSQAGVHVTVVNKREYRDSGLTKAAQRGAEYVGADRTGERIAAAVAAAGHRPSLTYLYDADLDWTGHRYGVDSSHWRQQLAVIDAQAEQLRETLPDSVRLVVVADHGMVDCPVGSRIDVDEHPHLRDGVTLIGGEARFRHLYCRTGADDDVIATWREAVAGRADVLTRAQAQTLGWFGAMDTAVTPRIGDVVVAAKGDFGVFSSARFNYETTLVGLHGSLTPEEMLIPMLVC